MRNRRKILFAGICISASIFLILLCLYCSPADLGRYLGVDGVIDPMDIAHINAVRLAAVIAGFLILIWGTALAVAPHLLESVAKWFKECPPKTKNFIALASLIALACACYLPFTYHGVFGERDSYRMLSGFIDSLNTGTPFKNPTLYARHHSFGYYAWLYLFSDTVKKDPHAAFALFNYTNTITAILMVIPLFFVVRRYWGLGAAIFANIILMTIPVWWQMSLYGHPQQIAVFFNFVGLALLCYRPRPAGGTPAKVKTLAVDLLIAAAFSLCLMNRLDCILMFPLILAILICEGYSVKSSVVRFAGYTLIPIFAFLTIDSYLPATDIPAGSSIGNTLKLLFRWHNPSRLVEHFGEANRIFISAYPGFLLLVFILACFYLLRRRKFTPLFFILPVVLINYFFWLPSPFPARHFVYLAPTLSIGIALLLASIGEQTTFFFSSSKLKTYIGVFLAFLSGYLCTSLMDGVPVYRGVYSPEDAITAGRLGEDLMKIPPENHPVFVVSDGILVIVKMQLASNSIKISKLDHHSLLVNNGKNDFIFCVQGWSRKSVSDLRKEAQKYHKSSWIVDPYNNSIYSKIKDFKPASTHSKAP